MRNCSWATIDVTSARMRRAWLGLFLIACENVGNAPPQAVPATQPTTVAAPSVETTLVHFSSRDKDITKGAPTELNGLLVRPAGGGKHPALVALHDCHGLTQPLSAEYTEWALLMRDKGYVVLFVDSFTPRGAKEGCGDKPAVAIRHRWRDAYGALDYLSAQGFVSAGHVGAMGWGAGGTVVLAAAEAQPPGARPFSLGLAIKPNCDGAARQTTFAAHLPLFLFSDETEPTDPACQTLARRRLEIKSLAVAEAQARAPDILFKYLGGKFK